jgi:methylmalonyl-CoA mutase cobalamin-binding subunit
VHKREVNRSVVIGTIGADAHMIGGWVLSKAFEDAGFKVAFLGAVVPQKGFINAAIEVDLGIDGLNSLFRQQAGRGKWAIWIMKSAIGFINAHSRFRIHV